MTHGPSETPAGTDRIFRGAREVVLVDGESQFRDLAVSGPQRCYLHGRVLGEDPRALAGRKSLADVSGRFVLAVHDPERRTLTLRNDRHGLVPFHRASSPGRLWFSTRIRPLVERGWVAGEPDLETLGDLLAFQLALGTRTLVAGVTSVAAGTSLRIDLDTLAVTETREWDPAALLREPRLSLAEVARELLARFLDGTRRCMAEEPVAVTLSGGLDTRCLLAAALANGRAPTAYHVGVRGSRAERYTRRIAELAGTPLRACLLDPEFAKQYLELLTRVVDATDGMKFTPQPEMLWLRDRVATPAVVLHGAFGELSKLRVLRDFRLDPALLRADRAALPGLLWRRFEPTFRSNLRIFAADFRESLEKPPPLHLRELVEGFDGDLGAAEVLQLCYLREFVKSARLGHQLWNERVATRFPFLEPGYVDLLLRVRTEERMTPNVQHRFLAEIAPRLHEVPDENTGTRAGAPLVWRRLVRLGDVVRIALFDSKVDANHGDLLAWIARMEPAPDELVAQWGSDPRYDRDHLAALVRVVRQTATGAALLRAASRRRGYRAARTLQTFFMTELWRRSLDAARRG